MKLLAVRLGQRCWGLAPVRNEREDIRVQASMLVTQVSLAPLYTDNTTGSGASVLIIAGRERVDEGIDLAI